MECGLQISQTNNLAWTHLPLPLDAAGFAPVLACQAVTFAELVQELPIRERGLFYPDIEALTAGIAGKISVIEAI